MTTELLSMGGVDLQENFDSQLSLEEFASKRAAEASDMLSLSVLDHFRCPKDFLDFGLSGELAFNEGFFRFGPDMTCYGRSVRSSGERQGEASLHDTFNAAGALPRSDRRSATRAAERGGFGCAHAARCGQSC